MGFVRDQVIARLRGDASHPVRRLDRWLLAILVDVGASPAPDIAGSRRFQVGRHGKGDPELMALQVRRWLESVKQRGFVRSTRPISTALRSARRSGSVSHGGRRRLKQVTGVRARLADVISVVVRAPNSWRDAVEAIRVEDTPAVGPPAPPRPHLPPITRNPGDEVSAEEARANLGKIDHVVVLMMENRIRGFPAEVLEGGRRLRAEGVPAGHP